MSAPPSLLVPRPDVLLGRPLLLAFSGGMDSTVLLELLARDTSPVRVAHVHHGLQAAADAWAAHCAEHCARRDLAFDVLRVRIDPQDARGPEGAARAARYAALRRHLLPGEVLVTAHHAEDQAETFLMRALRGSGPRGLSAMRELQVFDPGWLWRPLLHRHRSELKGFAQREGLSWIEDPHNADARFERSWLRTSVFPVLGMRRPQAAEALIRSAELCAEAASLLDERAAEDFAGLGQGRVLSVAGVRALSPARRHNLLRWWIGQICQLPPPPHTVMGEISRLLAARGDAEPRLGWAGGELRRYRDHLHAMPLLSEPPAELEIPWDGRQPLVLPAGIGRLSAAPIPSARRLRVRLPRGGERLRLAPDRPSRSLKNLFQEQAVPPWQRRRTPLIYEDGVLRWVGGLSAPSTGDFFYQSLVWTSVFAR